MILHELVVIETFHRSHSNADLNDLGGRLWESLHAHRKGNRETERGGKRGQGEEERRPKYGQCAELQKRLNESGESSWPNKNIERSFEFGGLW